MESISIEKLPRALRRQIKKKIRKPGAARQNHKSPRELLIDNGVATFARFVPLSDEQIDSLGLATEGRILSILEGSKEARDWGYLASGLMEGYLTAKALMPGDEQDYYVKQAQCAARLLDAAALHFERDGKVAETNINVVAEVLREFDDLKYHSVFDRADNLQILNYLSDHLDQTIIEVFRGKPKSFLKAILEN